MTPIMKFIADDVWQMRLRDGRNIYCDDDGRWWLTGQDGYYPTIFLLLMRNKLLTETKEGRDGVVKMFTNGINAQSLSDGELIDACLDEFSDLDVTSNKDALLQEVLTRFQKVIDLDETPKGITANGYPVWDDVIKD